MSKPTISLSPTPSHVNSGEERFNNIVACSPFSPPTNDSIFLQHPFSPAGVVDLQYSKQYENHLPSHSTSSIQPQTFHHHNQEQRDNNHHHHNNVDHPHIDIANYYSNEPSKVGVSFSESNLIALDIEDGKEKPMMITTQRQRMSRKRLVIGFFTFIILHTCAILVAMALFLGVYISDSSSSSDGMGFVNGTVVNSTTMMMQDISQQSTLTMSGSGGESIILSTSSVGIDHSTETLFGILWNFIIEKLIFGK